jgi:hypothetical protein
MTGTLPEWVEVAQNYPQRFTFDAEMEALKHEQYKVAVVYEDGSYELCVPTECPVPPETIEQAIITFYSLYGGVDREELARFAEACTYGVD